MSEKGSAMSDKPVIYVDKTIFECATQSYVSSEGYMSWRRGDRVNETDIALYPASAYEALQKELGYSKMAADAEAEFANEYKAKFEALKAENEAQAKRIADLESEDGISAAVIEKCSHLLSAIAVTLNGEQKELSRHSHHDLPELVSVLHLENELNKQRIAELEETNGLLQTQVHCLEMAASKNGDSK